MKIFVAIDRVLALDPEDKCNILVASAASPHEVASKIVHAKGNHLRNDPSVNPTSALLSEFGLAIATATWTEATLTLTQVGAFADIAYHASNELYVVISDGTGVKPGIYRVTARTDDTLVLSESIAETPGDLAGGDIEGYAFLILPYTSTSNLLSVLPGGGYVDAMDAGLLMHLQVEANEVEG